MGVFCNVKPELDPRGFTAPNVVGRAGVLPKRPLLVVQNVPKAPTSYSYFVLQRLDFNYWQFSTFSFTTETDNRHAIDGHYS